MKIPANRINRSVSVGLAILLAVIMGAGCAGIHEATKEEEPLTEFSFPKEFLWGAGTSSHQVEGNNTNNDWWEWEQGFPINMRSGEACDEWNRFEEDFQIARSLGHTAYRFSLEWSRIEPSPGQFDSSALDHYREMILSLRAKGIEPIITLNHFTIPLWFMEKGGWLSDESPELFARYVQETTEALGEEIHYWITINEPAVYVYRGYMGGEWPPGRESPKEAIIVLKNLLRGHVLAHEKIKEVYIRKGWKNPMVGVAQSVIVFSPSSKYSFMDQIVTHYCNWLFNELFIQTLMEGKVYFIGVFSIHLEKEKTLDFIGLNYYTRIFVRNNGFGFPSISIQAPTATESRIRNAEKDGFIPWEIYPKGLYTFLKDFARYKLPLLVSENGIATDDDAERVEFIAEHLKAVARAMSEGVPVIGYLYWSLLDNYEWAEGYAARFGLVEVDFNTQKRTVRDSAIKYGEIITSGKIIY